jgi:predicted GIY-YIG superfamily endonuclease
MRDSEMYFVYFIRSLSRPTKTDVGMTNNVDARLAVHNTGGCPSTARFRLWKLIAYVAVRDATTATELARYFKTGSGHAFWHKRFNHDPTCLE